MSQAADRNRKFPIALKVMGTFFYALKEVIIIFEQVFHAFSAIIVGIGASLGFPTLQPTSFTPIEDKPIEMHADFSEESVVTEDASFVVDILNSDTKYNEIATKELKAEKARQNKEKEAEGTAVSSESHQQTTGETLNSGLGVDGVASTETDSDTKDDNDESEPTQSEERQDHKVEIPKNIPTQFEHTLESVGGFSIR